MLTAAVFHIRGQFEEEAARIEAVASPQYISGEQETGKTDTMDVMLLHVKCMVRKLSQGVKRAWKELNKSLPG